ncbi:TPA: hypothetical protein DEP34_04265 [Candidatus Uhrbacteria bacterium]|uniref:Uncharacterized protein n=2 Tax=Candidatus Uhriibacteriota TaxID=1752732 RepID=A0A0G1T7Z6_9BACT|nr:MAG: hypothetical protein UX45_C0005G0018 [Candidatus Uhrbacteria bacterium GW2011_GWF2_46_218]KKU41525.1 MAG: hypothetical protein UX57_C0003G0025 [Candidatus Uhrbacteria bacterium GW2011_GWE2_46_68]HCB19564.1 hypothetical protein [Candidatus Uhrbacteria bacterium]
MRPLFISILTLAFSACINQPKTTGYFVYKGEITGYSVEIVDSLFGSRKDWTRIVHLNDTNRCSWCGIAGHDHENDGLWDAIFWCGYPEVTNGCNAFTQSTRGGWVWQPCPSDDGKVEPFTDTEILEAQSLLYKAVHDVYVPENMVEDLETWKWNRKME